MADSEADAVKKLT